MEGRKEGTGSGLPSSPVFGHSPSPGPHVEELVHPSNSALPVDDPGAFSSWGQCADGSYTASGFTGWNSFQPTLDLMGNSGLSSAPFSVYDEFRSSLSQPESNSDNGSESGGLFQTYPGSIEGLLSGPSLAATAESGRDLYTDALNQWVNYKTYEPFGTTDVFHSMENPVQEIHPQSSSNSSSPVNVNVSSKPSYSEVARNNLAGASQQAAPGKAKPTVSPPVKDGATFPEFPAAFGLPKVPFHRHKSSRPFISKPRSPSLTAEVLPPVMVEPDSKMGLDNFEEPSRKMKERGHHSFGGESRSNPQSRKGSTSSIGSGSSGLEEISSLWRSPLGASAAHLGDGSPPSDVRQAAAAAFTTTSPSQEASGKFDNLPSVSSENPKYIPTSHQGGGARQRSSSSPAHVSSTSTVNKKHLSTSQTDSQTKSKCDDTSKKRPFFDPKRIFESRSPISTSSSSNPSSSSSSSSCQPTNPPLPSPETSIPNNKQGGPVEDASTLLNNGKPKSNFYATNNVHGKPPASYYINNDLRQPAKKQTNTEGRNSPNRSQDKSTNTSSDQDSSRSESQSEANPQPRNEARSQGSSASRRKPDSTGKKSAAENKQCTKRSRRQKEGSSTAIGELVQHSLVWFKWGFVELMHYSLTISVLILKVALALLIFLVSCTIALAGKLWVTLCNKLPFLQFWPKRGAADTSPQARCKSVGLEKNIALPTTGEEAMKRLLACRGKDPYSILGVRCDATDEEIKRYYRRQAVLVHPDKNQQLGAEEAFKVLGHSFEIIGEPEKRSRYDAQRTETQETETAMQEFADLLSKLHDKMQEAANLMRCDNCGGKHRRVPTERPWYNARFCDRCNSRHSAKEGDIWAESTMMGFLWHYYACMEGKIYDITEWASCQCGNFQHIQANAHHVIYRIATQGNSRQRQQQSTGRNHEVELEDFINHLFSRTGRTDATPGDPAQAPPSSTSSSSATSGKKRRKKKKH